MTLPGNYLFEFHKQLVPLNSYLLDILISTRYKSNITNTSINQVSVTNRIYLSFFFRFL